MALARLRYRLARLLLPADDESTTNSETNTRHHLPDPAEYSPNRDQVGQLQLKFHYQQLARHSEPLPAFHDVEFRTYSQNGEDGILLFLFAVLGTTNKRSVEMCSGEGIQCNTANLIINHGWRGMLVDGDEAAIEKGRAFYQSCRDTLMLPPKLVSTWITRDNVNDLLRYHNITGSIDLFSLDMDSNDYWIWKALDVIEPRVVILEYQNAFPADRKVTQKYQEGSQVSNVKGARGLPKCGASLAAFVALGREKGYRLVGCEHQCINAIFIKNGIADDVFPEVSAEQCLQSPLAKIRRNILLENEHQLPDMWEQL